MSRVEFKEAEAGAELSKWVDSEDENSHLRADDSCPLSPSRKLAGWLSGAPAEPHHSPPYAPPTL